MLSKDRASSLIPLPSKQALLDAYNGLPLSALPTPALVLDRAILRRNAARMAQIAQSWNVDLRIHVKTHKTIEGTREMLKPTTGPGRVVVSTLAEAWHLLRGGLIREGIVEDILYGLPVSASRIPTLIELRSCLQAEAPRTQLRLIVDNDAQVQALAAHQSDQPWSIMVKIDNGGRRAGLATSSPALSNLLNVIAKSKSFVTLHGFYAHAGHSYDSRSAADADEFLTSEVQAVSEAATLAFDLGIVPTSSLVLSVGSTPTAHAASRAPSSQTLARVQEGIPRDCRLELHAGNYPFLDLQQLATRAMPTITGAGQPSQMGDVAVAVLCSIVSVYPDRGNNVGGEALIDGAGIAFSKDRGPWGGFGHVIYPKDLRGWELGRPSQEHGVLTLREGGPEEWAKQWTLNDDDRSPEAGLLTPRISRVGEQVLIVPQHACMTLAAHPFYFIVDQSAEDATTSRLEHRIVDVWVPTKGW